MAKTITIFKAGTFTFQAVTNTFIFHIKIFIFPPQFNNPQNWGGLGGGAQSSGSASPSHSQAETLLNVISTTSERFPEYRDKDFVHLLPKHIFLWNSLLLNFSVNILRIKILGRKAMMQDGIGRYISKSPLSIFMWETFTLASSGIKT